MGTPLPNTPNPHLSNTLRSRVEWLAGQKIPYVIIGGVAVPLLAKPRFTQDVAVAVSFDLHRLEELPPAASLRTGRMLWPLRAETGCCCCGMNLRASVWTSPSLPYPSSKR